MSIASLEEEEEQVGEELEEEEEVEVRALEEEVVSTRQRVKEEEVDKNKPTLTVGIPGGPRFTHVRTIPTRAGPSNLGSAVRVLRPVSLFASEL